MYLRWNCGVFSTDPRCIYILNSGWILVGWLFNLVEFLVGSLLFHDWFLVGSWLVFWLNSGWILAEIFFFVAHPFFHWKRSWLNFGWILVEFKLNPGWKKKIIGATLFFRKRLVVNEKKGWVKIIFFFNQDSTWIQPRFNQNSTKIFFNEKRVGNEKKIQSRFNLNSTKNQPRTNQEPTKNQPRTNQEPTTEKPRTNRELNQISTKDQPRTNQDSIRIQPGLLAYRDSCAKLTWTWRRPYRLSPTVVVEWRSLSLSNRRLPLPEIMILR